MTRKNDFSEMRDWDNRHVVHPWEGMADIGDNDRTFVEDATDGLAKIVETALSDWQEGDAQVVITAGQLTAKSALRKVIEGHRNAVAIGLYDDPPTMADIELAIKDAGLPIPERDVMEMLVALANTLEPGDFRQTLEKVSLYKGAILHLSRSRTSLPARPNRRMRTSMMCLMLSLMDRTKGLARYCAIWQHKGFCLSRSASWRRGISGGCTLWPLIRAGLLQGSGGCGRLSLARAATRLCDRPINGGVTGSKRR